MSKKSAQKLLLIGWDAADWKAINPLIDAGLMPNLAKLVNGGVMGRLATLDPPLSPMLWTSIGTGMRPYKHGISGFTEPSPDGSGVRPIYGSSRKVKAIWNILTQKKYKTHLVGWWPSHPAEPINGICISNFYQKANKGIEEKWEMMEGTVYPEERSDFFADIRIHPGELTPAHIVPFVPNAHKIDFTNEAFKKRLDALAQVTAETATIHNAATYIMEHEEWDFMGVYFDGIDHYGHGFMKFHPPKMDHIRQDEFDAWNNVVTAGYRFHDMKLGRLMKLAGEDTTIMLISDHGFHPDHLRPKHLPFKSDHAAPAMEHSPYGIICINGPNIKKDELIHGASILDITPTILQMFDLPVGEDMDGKVMITAFEEPKPIQTIDSWENVEGEAGLHPKDMQEDPKMAAAMMEQLIELGYVEAPGDDVEKSIQKTKDINSYFMARAYIDAYKYDSAIPILERLWKEDPERKHFGIHLVKCYQQLQQFDKAKAVLNELEESILEDTSGLKLMKATQLMSERKFRSAFKELKKAEQMDAQSPFLNLQIAQHFFQLGQFEEAVKAYNKELKIDPDSAQAFHGKGIAYIKLGKYEKAAESLLDSIGLKYNSPIAHYHFGEALYQMGEFERSAEAFEVCLKMNPGINRARQRLIKLYKEQLNQPERITALEEAIIESVTQNEMLIVSGLPRTGTSMMMQMLEKGGLEVFTDKLRVADDNNPKGYYEHEAIKALMRDQKILKQVGDKAVKIVAPLLSNLPAKFKYKIIFMERDLTEVLNSQHNMLQRLNRIKEDTHSLSLRLGFEATLSKVKKWIAHQKYIDVLYLNYSDVVKNPLQEAQKVQNFIGKPINTQKMAAVVDPTLYREKTIQDMNA